MQLIEEVAFRKLDQRPPRLCSARQGPPPTSSSSPTSSGSVREIVAAC